MDFKKKNWNDSKRHIKQNQKPIKPKTQLESAEKESQLHQMSNKVQRFLPGARCKQRKGQVNLIGECISKQSWCHNGHGFILGYHLSHFWWQKDWRGASKVELHGHAGMYGSRCSFPVPSTYRSNQHFEQCSDMNGKPGWLMTVCFCCQPAAEFSKKLLKGLHGTPKQK